MSSGRWFWKRNPNNKHLAAFHGSHIPPWEAQAALWSVQRQQFQYVFLSHEGALNVRHEILKSIQMRSPSRAINYCNMYTFLSSYKMSSCCILNNLKSYKLILDLCLLKDHYSMNDHSSVAETQYWSYPVAGLTNLVCLYLKSEAE